MSVFYCIEYPKLEFEHSLLGQIFNSKVDFYADQSLPTPLRPFSKFRIFFDFQGFFLVFYCIEYQKWEVGYSLLGQIFNYKEDFYTDQSLLSLLTHISEFRKHFDFQVPPAEIQS